MKVGGQTSMNIHDVQKLALETSKCFLMGPSLFKHVMCICILGETYVEGINIFKGLINV